MELGCLTQRFNSVPNNQTSLSDSYYICLPGMRVSSIRW